MITLLLVCDHVDFIYSDEGEDYYDWREFKDHVRSLVAERMQIQEDYLAALSAGEKASKFKLLLILLRLLTV